MKDNDLIGRVVISTAGRDSERLFIIIDVLDEKYVLISDGKLKTEEKPKKKKIKHLFFTNKVAEDIRRLIVENKQVSNSMIRRFLQLNDVDKEVWLPYVKGWCYRNGR